jgi:hypothetical protein
VNASLRECRDLGARGTEGGVSEFRWFRVSEGLGAAVAARSSGAIDSRLLTPVFDTDSDFDLENVNWGVRGSIRVCGVHAVDAVGDCARRRSA